MKNEKDIKKRIASEKDYIYSPKNSNSLNKLMSIEKNAEGIEDKKIAKVLLMDTKELNKIYQGILKKIRKNMGVEDA